MSTPAEAAEALATLQWIVDRAIDTLRLSTERATSRTKPGREPGQVAAYDIAHAAAGVASAANLLSHGAESDDDARLAVGFAAEVAHDVAGRLLGRERAWGADEAALGALDGLRGFIAAGRDPQFLAQLAGIPRQRLTDEYALVADTFRRFASERIMPVAEHVHRSDSDVPDDIIEGLAELGAFGLSVPAGYGGFAEHGQPDLQAMVIATEELSRGSLGIGGSLITRPEVLTRTLLAGGTEAQKQHWLPRLASGEIMAAVAVTEPDFGSDVASLRVTALRDGDRGWIVNGTKTWCTFAGRAEAVMLLARTTPGSTDHRGLSVFVFDKPRSAGKSFAHTQPDGGRLEGRAIDTIGYRGMHSFELRFDDWWLPADALIGESAGEGRGFHLQMAGFENGRLQTAARAVGVMQAAYDAAAEYAEQRIVFGRPVAEHQLTQAKLGRMAMTIEAARRYTYHVAALMRDGHGALEAAMVKASVCRAAEWVTREAMQIHGGMGYAEEGVVSRCFVDARVLSIFEGTDEVLCLKVIVRRLLAERSKTA